MVDQRLTDMNADQTWERPTKVCRFCLHFASLPARDAVPLPADPSHARRALHRLAQRPSCAEAVSRRGLDRTCTSKDQKRWPRSIQWASVLLQSSGCRERFLRQSSIGVDGRLGLISMFTDTDSCGERPSQRRVLDSLPSGLSLSHHWSVDLNLDVPSIGCMYAGILHA